ncbi:MAG: YlmH/Sll1252 family protein [Heliobacteriaceae bacterium]|nr:YlmH/Sll1252 family protein [Heliobacteriaceae bacterium]
MISPKKESILNLARNPEEKIFLARCFDQVCTVKGRDLVLLTDFLDPGQVGLLKSVCRGYRGLSVLAWGGYLEAERCRALISTGDDSGQQPDFQIETLQVLPIGKEAAPGHRDYLGSLLGLGIKREVIGDIVPLEVGMAVFVSREMAAFLGQNLNRVGKYPVSVSLVAQVGLALKTRQLEKRVVTVAALRLDALISKAFNLSRSASAALIRQGKVKQNWRQQTDPATDVATGDMIACRGYGKFRLSEDAGPTKKGRLRLILEFPI